MNLAPLSSKITCKELKKKIRSLSRPLQQLVNRCMEDNLNVTRKEKIIQFLNSVKLQMLTVKD